MPSIAIVYYSAQGHTHELAEAVADGAKGIDACSGIWFQQGWKNKVAAGFTHSQGLSGDKLNTLNGLFINAMQHGMIWVGNAILPEGDKPEMINWISSYTGLMAQSGYGQASIGEGDKKTAGMFGQRVAEATARWLKGK